MHIVDVIGKAREIQNESPVVSRDSLFASRGMEDLSKFNDTKPGGFFAKSTNVRGGKGKAVHDVVCDKVKKNIYLENVILAESTAVAKMMQEDMGDNETISWVEKYEHIKGQPYFLITCVSKTFCGARFAVCKELMHIYTDTVDGVKPANALIKCAMKWQDLIISEDKQLDSETACFYSAIEVMLPWELRRSQFTMLTDLLNDDPQCNMTIARSFMVPVKVIDHIRDARDARLPYCGFSYDINTRLDKQE